MAARARSQWVRILLAQRHFVPIRLLLGIAALAVAVVLALFLAPLVGGMAGGEALRLARGFVAKVLPLWALALTALAWTDAEGRHRHVLRAWPGSATRLAGAKLLYGAVGYAVIAAIASVALAVGLTTLVPGAPALAAWAVWWALMAPVFVTSVATFLILSAILTAAGGLGQRWFGTAAAGALWLAVVVMGDGMPVAAARLAADVGIPGTDAVLAPPDTALLLALVAATGGVASGARLLRH